MIKELKQNLDLEIAMTIEMNKFFDNYQTAGPEERRLYSQLMNSLLRRIELINDSVPELLDSVSLIKKIGIEKIPEVENVPVEETHAVISKKNKEEFLKELNISEVLVNKLKKKEKHHEKIKASFLKQSTYGKISNRFFLDRAQSLLDRGKLKSLTLDVKRSNSNILSATYVSMMFFSTVLAFIIGWMLFIFLMIFSVSFESPFVSLYSGDHLLRFAKLLALPFALALIGYGAFYFYPGAEKRSLGKRIEQELPFVVIHMASISGSGIEPLAIFRIIALSKEYKYVGQEIRKILNQTNLFGYDLSTALRNVSMTTPSPRFSELLNGMSVNINSGGDIRTFFEKRAESLLLDYRLEREGNTKTAETFMDMYISIVIATPMILLILLVMINVSGVQTGFNSSQMTVAIIGIVAMVNIAFLMFLHMKQPGY